jgi:hypothetical protein
MWVETTLDCCYLTHNVCKTVCLSEGLLVYGYTIRAVLADHGTVSYDLSKSASRTRKNVFQKQISCLGES